MDLAPSPRQRELIDLARRLARERFAPRAERHDREASFPFDDYADLRAAGLLGLCVPERHGGLGADYETYCLVAEQIAQGNASTALTFNMHCLTMLMMGVIADTMPMAPAARERHEKLRAAKFREVVEAGVFYGQPHSEPVEQGQTDTALSVGGRRFGTTARKVDGGYVVNGRKFFVSLAGSAPYFATPAIRLGDEPWIERTLYLQVPKDAPGVSFPGEWDPMGMRATVSRDMVLKDVFVPDDGEVLPPGMFGAMYNSFPHLSPLTFCATFLGLMQAAYDGALGYLRGEMAGSPGLHTEAAVKGHAVAEMLFTLEGARALYYRAIAEARVGAPPGSRAARPRRARDRAAVGGDRHPGGHPRVRRPGPAQALPPRAIRARRARGRPHAAVDAGDRHPAGMGSGAGPRRGERRAMTAVTARAAGGAHLVGSVPMDDAETVFRAVAGALGPHLRRIPDGETGERRRWIFFQNLMLRKHPDMEEDPTVPPFALRQWDGKLLREMSLLRFRPDVDPEGVRFETGYAAAARDSYAVFARLQGEGVIPAHLRFQVCLPTPMASGYMYVSPRAREAYLPAYERALLRALDDIVAAVPPRVSPSSGTCARRCWCTRVSFPTGPPTTRGRSRWSWRGWATRCPPRWRWAITSATARPRTSTS